MPLGFWGDFWGSFWGPIWGASSSPSTPAPRPFVSAFFCNDLPLSEVGFVGIPPFGDIRDSYREEWQQNSIPGRAGVALSAIASGKGKAFTIWGRVEIESIDDLQPALDRIRRPMRGMWKFRAHDVPDRFIWVRTIGDVVQTDSRAALTAKPRKVGITLFAPDPVWYDVNVMSVKLSDGGTAEVPCGDMPGPWIAYRFGAIESGETVTLRYYGITGALLGSVSITPTIDVGENDSIEVDRIRRRITHIASDGTRTNRNAWKTGVQPWPNITPSDSDVLGVYPRVGWSSGEGMLFTRRAWK